MDQEGSGRMDTGTLPVAEARHDTADLPPVVSLHGPRRMFTARVALPPVTRFVAPNAALLAAVSLFLAGFGLLMVLSSSSVEAGQVAGNPFAAFVRQGAATFLGIPLLLVAGRAPHRL